MRSQSSDRFDRFTERARKVLTLAQEESAWLNHDYIGSEHLLLGLVREGDGVAAKVLASLGVELNEVRLRTEAKAGRGEMPIGPLIGLAPDAKKVIELAVDEARRLNHHYIGTEHLLLGLARVDEGGAAGILEGLGASLDRVRAQVVSILSQAGPPRSGPWATTAVWLGPAAAAQRASHLPPLRALRRVVPIAQAQSHRGLQVTLLSLEEYAEGFLVNGMILREDAEEIPMFPELILRATDDRGGHYESWPAAGTGGQNRWRFAFGFTGPLDANAQQITVDARILWWRHLKPGGRELVLNRIDADRWSFTVPIPEG